MKMALFNITKWLPRVNGKTSETNNIKGKSFQGCNRTYSKSVSESNK